LWFGWLWWGDVLDALAFMGIGLIVAAGLYTLHRERASLRAVARPALNRTSAQ
jgi:drug/metabolite transporter (DMT)-like permease